MKFFSWNYVMGYVFLLLFELLRRGHSGWSRAPSLITPSYSNGPSGKNTFSSLMAPSSASRGWNPILSPMAPSCASRPSACNTTPSPTMPSSASKPNAWNTTPSPTMPSSASRPNAWNTTLSPTMPSSASRPSGQNALLPLTRSLSACTERNIRRQRRSIRRYVRASHLHPERVGIASDYLVETRSNIDEALDDLPYSPRRSVKDQDISSKSKNSGFAGNSRNNNHLDSSNEYGTSGNEETAGSSSDNVGQLSSHLQLLLERAQRERESTNTGPQIQAVEVEPCAGSQGNSRTSGITNKELNLIRQKDALKTSHLCNTRCATTNDQIFTKVSPTAKYRQSHKRDSQMIIDRLLHDFNDSKSNAYTQTRFTGIGVHEEEELPILLPKSSAVSRRSVSPLDASTNSRGHEGIRTLRELRHKHSDVTATSTAYQEGESCHQTTADSVLSTECKTETQSAPHEDSVASSSSRVTRATSIRKRKRSQTHDSKNGTLKDEQTSNSSYLTKGEAKEETPSATAHDKASTSTDGPKKKKIRKNVKRKKKH